MTVFEVVCYCLVTFEVMRISALLHRGTRLLADIAESLRRLADGEAPMPFVPGGTGDEP